MVDRSAAVTEFRARIARVRMKDGGADVVVLDGSDRCEIARDLVEQAGVYADDTDEASQLAGYVLIAFYSDNARAVAYHRPDSIPGELLPAYVAELVRRKCVMQAEACDVVNRANGYDV